jgi:hypothetical protein
MLAFGVTVTAFSELERLLGTATDQERKEMIKKALSALDASESAAPATNGATNFIQSLHPSAHAHLFAKVRHSGLCINVGPLMYLCYVRRFLWTQLGAGQ